MHQQTSRTRILGGLTLLAVAVALVVGNRGADAVAQDARKKDEKQPYGKKADPSKQPVRVTGTLAADAKLDALKLAAHVDKLVGKKLNEEKVEPSAVCTDAEFLRRAYLDLTGKIPTAEKARAFLDSKDARKREKLIDELLSSNDFGTFQADVWQAQLLPRDSDNVRLRQWYPNLTTWLEKQFNDNPGWDRTVKDFLTASGAVEKNGPVIYWLAQNTPDKMTDSVTRMFMGIQLQCAQCHNHPFTDYKQNDYWHTAAFFMKVGPDGNPKKAAKDGNTISVGETGKVRRKLANPDAKVLPPKFFQDRTEPAIEKNGALRPVFANWVTAKTNPFFAKAMANRTWGSLLGRGLVAPVDDMHDGNPPSHPELLADLSSQFVANGFDVKYLYRAICNSQTYQRSSKAYKSNADAGPELFARAAVRPLTPGQMWDSLHLFVGTDRTKGKGPKQGANVKGFGNNPRLQFILSYGIEDGADPTEYQAGIPQVLRLMNAGQMNNTPVLAALLRSSKSDREIVEALYLTVLSRRPTAEDQERFDRHVRRSAAPRERKFADLLWALMNSSEFALNR